MTCTSCGARPAGTRRWESERGLCHACYVCLGKAGRLAPLPAQPMTLGVVRDCAHKRAHHAHGTRNAYVLDRCGCAPCTKANRDYENARVRMAAAHQWAPERPATPTDLVDAGPAREHLQALMAAGMGLKTIAAKSGVAHGSISAVVYGKPTPDPKERRPPRRRITRDLEARILAIGLQLADGATVDGTGTARRLQALVACGWSISKLAARLGFNPSNITPVVHGTRQVTVATRRAVAALYDELWDAAPPEADQRARIAASRSRRFAATRGWVPPLAWDDDAIDDPAAAPASSEATTWGRTVEDVEFLAETGEDLAGVLDRLGIGRDAVYNACTRAGRLDLWRRLTAERVARPRARIASRRAS